MAHSNRTSAPDSEESKKQADTSENAHDQGMVLTDSRKNLKELTDLLDDMRRVAGRSVVWEELFVIRKRGWEGR